MKDSLRSVALHALRKLIAVKGASEAARAALKKVDDAVYSDFSAIPYPIESELVRLIDAVLDADGIAAYLLYEAMSMAGGGRIEFPDGRKYPIRTIEDVENLLREGYPE